MAPNITTGKACVTFLAGNGDYVRGVVGLAKGLRRSRPSTLLWLQFCLMSTVRYWFHKDAWLERLSLCIHLRIKASLPWPIVSSITPIKPGFTRSLLSVSDNRFFFFFFNCVCGLLSSDTCYLKKLHVKVFP